MKAVKVDFARFYEVILTWNLERSTVGVVRSLSPWVEHVLRSEGAIHVVTVDYNERAHSMGSSRRAWNSLALKLEHMICLSRSVEWN